MVSRGKGGREAGDRGQEAGEGRKKTEAGGPEMGEDEKECDLCLTAAFFKGSTLEMTYKKRLLKSGTEPLFYNL